MFRTRGAINTALDGLSYLPNLNFTGGGAVAITTTTSVSTTRSTTMVPRIIER